MKFFKAFSAIIITAGFVYVLEIKIGSAPPIGPFLNPSTGFWQNAESKNILPQENLKLNGLKGKVVIKFDDNRIPHIFAENDSPHQPFLDHRHLQSMKHRQDILFVLLDQNSKFGEAA